MSLNQLQLQLSYRTGRGDMVKGLFVPCLEQSILYRRAAGYFTSFGLGLAARGVASLASRKGTMRLVASPHLEPDDVEALRNAAERPAEVLRRITSRSLTEIEDALLRDRLNALAWLAASGSLEIRLALRLDEDGKEKDSEIGQAAMRLLIRRARLLGSAQNKLEVLDQVSASLPERPKKALFYCGDGRTTDTIADEEVRQIQAVSRLLGEKHGLKVRNFTFRESTEEREEILRDLASGFLDGVVAIRCLDEGIDVPDLRMGFLLASSTNPRQFVQRRGRLLRHAPGKKRAIIHDFIIQPPDFGGTLAWGLSSAA